MNGTTPQSRGWVDTIASKLNFDGFLKKFNITTAILIETVSYFGVGVLFGFVVKHYLKQILITALVFFLLLKGLEYIGIGVMVLNWERIKMMIGMGPQDTLDTLGHAYFIWVQTHVRQVVSWIIGFLVGLRLL